MLIPDPLRDLLEQGTVRQVLRQLKSGKEASVYVVEAEGGLCAAKVYKRLEARNFRRRDDYVEGRRSADSREQRAMDRGSRFGRRKREESWQNAECDAMRRLFAGGVRIPRPYANHDGVLLMDLVRDASGAPAPQIAAGRYDRVRALALHRAVMHQVAAMLRCGLVHADLSEFNILAAADGPVIIDLPQAVDAAANPQAKRLLLRDVANITRFFGRFAPDLRRTAYGDEMWLLHQNGDLRPETVLTGRFQAAREAVDARLVLQAIEDAKRDAARREEVRAWREAQRAPKR